MMCSMPSTQPLTVRTRLFDWSRQPSTQQGLSLFAAGCALAWAHPFPAAEGIAATLLAASLPKLWPDNTSEAIRASTLSTAVAHALVTRKAADLEQLAENAATILAAPALVAAKA